MALIFWEILLTAKDASKLFWSRVESFLSFPNSRRDFLSGYPSFLLEMLLSIVELIMVSTGRVVGT